MRKLLSSVAVAAALAFLASASFAQGVTYGGTPVRVHSGATGAFHFLIPGSGPSGGWWGSYNVNDASVANTAEADKRFISWNASGGTVPCNPGVCGTSTVRGAQGLGRGEE